jgi:hypothetical protein
MNKAMKKTLLMIWFFAQSGFAATHSPITISRTETTFLNSNCARTNTCSLKKVHFVADQYQIRVGADLNYGTRMVADYRTAASGDLKDYAFVQFIRGCQFESQEINHKIVYSSSITRELFDKMVTFRSPNWIIDSIDSDPMYNSLPNNTEFPRHVLYRYMDHGQVKFYGNQIPTDPTLFVRDLPGQSFAELKDNWAQNTSLEFKTCMYKTKDIPLRTTPENLNFARPITCFSWHSSYVFNHKTKKFGSSKEIHPYCK